MSESGPLEPFIANRRVRRIGAGTDPLVGESEVVLSQHRLQNIPDYRSALQQWFEGVVLGGYLIVVVPHAFLSDRKLALPSPWRPYQRRLYTPASLLGEIEEALAPNSYRVRWLGDLDRGYDYHLSPSIEPVGDSDVAVVLERIEPPAWLLLRELPTSLAWLQPLAPAAFEPPRTRVEIQRRSPVERILILKLDHLGDLVMGLPALERARRCFADARIDLVVGSWNEALARDLGVADRVIAFDAFPRNSSEEEPLVVATIGQFRALMTDEYDLAIDLRTDIDTRVLLREVRAPLKAAIGTRARYPFLDIALPLDDTRNDADRARDDVIQHHAFSCQGSARRGPFGIGSDHASVERDCAIVWGPYFELDAGNYMFDFYLDLAEQRGDGLIRLDIALDGGATVAEMIVSGPANYHLAFRVEKPSAVFEARITTVEGHDSIDFVFHGGRLMKQGPGNVLHQSEYASLLIELVNMRVNSGFLHEVPG